MNQVKGRFVISPITHATTIININTYMSFLDFSIVPILLLILNSEVYVILISTIIHLLHVTVGHNYVMTSFSIAIAVLKTTKILYTVWIT